MLGCFYFLLSNVPPKFRSKLSSIQLLALIKVDLLQQYGMDSVLGHIVNDVKKLEKVIELIHESRCMTIRDFH